jgi:dihydrofolate reductase
MGKISSFNFITLNGFLNGPQGDISWHRHGIEENQYALDGLKSGSILLFGRITYEMMAGYWPSPLAIQNDPLVAAGMNNAEKIVISRSLKNAEWNNTRVINHDPVNELKSLKERSENDITLLGSGSILSLLSENGLIDEYQIMIDPVAIGSGSPIFNKIKQNLNLKITNMKSFKSGVVLLSYQPY